MNSVYKGKWADYDFGNLTIDVKKGCNSRQIYTESRIASEVLDELMYVDTPLYLECRHVRPVPGECWVLLNKELIIPENGEK